MYVDKNLMVTTSTGQTLVASAGTVLCAYSIDLGSATRGIDPGKGKPVAFIVTMDTALTDTETDWTVKFEIITDAVAAMTTGPTIISTSRAIVMTQLTAGAVFVLPIAANLIGSADRYLGLRTITSGTGTPTTGLFHAFVAFDW